MHKNKCKHTKYIIELFIVVFCKYLTSMYMTTKATMKSMNQFFKNIHDNVQDLNKSKVFAGLMIITLNIASRFVTIKLSKSMESYLKYTFSKQILIFAIAWMGTRDIYIAFIIVIVFTICMDFLFNEDSMFCCLPENFTSYHHELIDNDKISEEDVAKAKQTLEKAEKQKLDEEKGIHEESIKIESSGIINY